MIADKVGLLDLLSTEDKSTVVAAINEVMAAVDWNKITLDKNLKEVSDRLDNLKLYAYKELGDNYTMTESDFDKVGFYMIGSLADTVTDDGIKNIPDNNVGDYKIIALNPNRKFQTLLMTSPRYNNVFYSGRFWDGKWQGWTRIANTENLSNPNLLINTDFKDVINQRGQAEYTSGYSIDRWRVFGGALKVNGNQVILAKVGDVNGYLAQRIENGVNLLKNKTVTLSIGIDGDAYSMPVNVSALTTIFDSGNLMFPGGYADVYGNSSWVEVRVFAREGEITLDWIKLEFGDVATMYVPPNQAEELLKCQRYFIKLLNQEGEYAPALGFGYTNGNTYARVSVPIPVRMRTVPDFVFLHGSLDNLYVIFDGKNYKVLSIVQTILENNQVFFILETESHNTDDQTCVFRIRISGNVALDAEIY